MEPIFEESELKVELKELGHPSLTVAFEEQNVGDEEEVRPDEEHEVSMEPGPSGMYPVFEYELVEEEELEEGSADEILGDLYAEDTADEEEEEEEVYDEIDDNYSSSLLKLQEEVGELTPEEMNFPPILNQGTPKILPDKVIQVLETFREEIKRTVGPKSYSALSPAEKKSADKVIRNWLKESPITAEDVEEQLKTEMLAFALVNCALKKSSGIDDDVENEEEESRPALFSKLGLLSDLFTKRGSGENLVSKFVTALREDECFQKYKPQLDLMSEEQISTLVWDCSIQTQRVIVRLTKLHEAVISALGKLSQLNRLASETTKKEFCVLAAATRREAEKNILTLDTSELTTRGRKNMIRGFSAPYFKTPHGFAAPEWNPYPLPFKYEQLRLPPINEAEMEVLQVSVLKAVVEAKQNLIVDRCNQLLIRYGRGGIVEQRITSKGHPFELQVLCPAEDLLRWKALNMRKAEKTTLEEIAKDATVRINWFSVADKMSKRASRYYYPEECERIWNNLVLPRVLTNKHMTFEELQKLMSLVKKYGPQKWTVIAKEMGYSPFQCFAAFEAFREGEMGKEERIIRRQADVQSGLNKFTKIVKLAKDFQPQITRQQVLPLGCKIAELLLDMPNVPLQTLAEQYLRTLKPEQKGPFKVVEDILLLVCMVKMREYLVGARSFAPIKDYLPWRFVSAWACRAEVLFGPRYTLWTREDDLKLLGLVQRHKKFDWSLFSKVLGCEKNRKGVRRRYLKLMERLKCDTFENIRKEYESRNRQPVYTTFQKYLPPLQNALNQPPMDPPSFEELSNSPDEVILWNYLQSFDKWLLQETIQDLESVIAVSAEKEKDVVGVEETVEAPKIAKPNIDRRKFVRGDPVSTASALHLRKVPLKPRDSVPDLSQFEQEVYDYFEYFNEKLPKTKTKHPYLPEAKDFHRMAEIQRILDSPSTEENAVTLETDGVSLDPKGFPILVQVEPKQPARKPRKRRGIALRNLAKAHERRRKAQRADEDDVSCAGKDQDDIDVDNDEESDCGSQDVAEASKAASSNALDNDDSRSVTPQVTVLVKSENADGYEFEGA